MVIFFGCRFRSTDRYDGLSRAFRGGSSEKVRPSVTREGTPLANYGPGGNRSLGSTRPIRGRETLLGSYSTGLWGDRRIENGLVRSLGAKHTAVSYDGVTDYGCAKRASRYQPFLVGITWRWFPYRSDNRMTSSKRQGCMPRQELEYTNRKAHV